MNIQSLNEGLQEIVRQTPTLDVDTNNIEYDANALKQRQDETDEEFHLFHLYAEMSGHEVNPTELSNLFLRYYSIETMHDIDILKISTKHDWVVRKLSLLALRQYLLLESDKLTELEKIKLFQGQTSTIAEKSLDITTTLLDKLEQRIEFLEPEAIQVSDIPAFIRAAKTLGDFANDNTSMVLALADIMNMFTEVDHA